MSDKILISIIIPTYNRAATIGKTIDSFIAQDYTAWEMLVVDDNSTDNTKDVIEQYHEKDYRIHYLLNERRKGAQGARNTGILHAKSDWVILFDSDDYAYPNFVSRIVAEIDDKTDVISCYVRKVWVDGSQTSIEEWGAEGKIEHLMLRSWAYIGFLGGYRKSKLFEIGLLDEDCPCMQEWDTHIRLSRICTYKQIKEPLMDYMWGNEDAISKNRQKNKNGYCYVMKHNETRWKEIEPDAFYSIARWLFFDVDVEHKWMLLKMHPRMFFRLPRMLLGRIKRGLYHKT